MKRWVTLSLAGVSLVGLLVVCSCTVQNGTVSPEPQTFSNYGFSFEYPSDFVLLETGSLEGDNSYQEGSVVVRTQAEGINSFGILWLEAEPDEEPYSFLEERIDLFVTDPDLKEVSHWNEDTRSGYHLIYRAFTVTSDSGGTLHGVTGGLYSEDSQRCFVFYYTNSTVNNREKAIANLMAYLDTFRCE